LLLALLTTQYTIQYTDIQIDIYTVEL